MFISSQVNKMSVPNKWSVRRQPNGVYIAVDDSAVAFNPNPVVSQNLPKLEAQRQVQSLNKKRGPEFGFDFKG